jgi:hypothetical protein
LSIVYGYPLVLFEYYKLSAKNMMKLIGNEKKAKRKDEVIYNLKQRKVMFKEDRGNNIIVRQANEKERNIF